MTVDEYKKRFGGDCFRGFFPSSFHNLIDEVIRRINAIYIPFTCLYVRDRKPKLRNEINETEDEVRIAVLCNNEIYLRNQLGAYYKLWEKAIGEFDKVKEKFIPF